jgi:hypothetical protein
LLGTTSEEPVSPVPPSVEEPLDPQAQAMRTPMEYLVCFTR